MTEQTNPRMPRRHCRRGRALAAGLLLLLVGLSGCASGPTPEERERDMKVGRARRNVGIDYLANGRTPMAIRELRHSHLLAPDDPVTIHWLGEAYRRRGLLDQALVHMQDALDLDPESHELRMNLGGLYLQLGKYREAIEQAQVLVDDPTFPSPWRAYTNLGWAQFQLGLLSEARGSFEEALAFKQNYWPARLNLGILEAKSGRSTAAIVAFEGVLERNNLDLHAESEATYRLGQAYVSLGERHKAIEYFKRSAERVPLGHWAQQSEEYMKLLQ